MPVLGGYAASAFDIVNGSSALSVGDRFRLDPGFNSDNDAISFDVSDNDANLDGDGGANETGHDGDQSAVVRDASGNTIASGQIYIEDARTLTAPDGSQITLYKMELGGSHVGWLTSEPLQPGVTYEIDDQFDITGSTTSGSSGDGDGDGSGDGDGDGSAPDVIDHGNAPAYTDPASVNYDPEDHNTIQGGAYADYIEANLGNDTINAGDADDTVYGGHGADTVTGDAGGDRLFGDAGSDVLFGGTGGDTLDGGADADTLYGGSGNDTMTGGTGSDVFVFDSADYSALGTSEDIQNALLELNLAQIENWQAAKGLDASAGEVSTADASLINVQDIGTEVKDSLKWVIGDKKAGEAEDLVETAVTDFLDQNGSNPIAASDIWTLPSTS